MDMMEEKPRMMALYEGNASINHWFLLHIRMHLVPEHARLMQDRQTLCMPGDVDYQQIGDFENLGDRIPG